MKFQTINTGSDGNCFLADDSLLIDLGISYKKLSENADLSKIKYVLLTHIHGDHFNKTAIRKLHVNYPDVIFVAGSHLHEDLKKIGVKEKSTKLVWYGEMYDLSGFKVAPVLTYHDVENFGYRIMKNNHKHLHITDTSTLEGITAKDYDSASIECNHCENKALELIAESKQNGEFTHLVGAMNSHLSVQQTVQFCKENNIKNLIPVHIGNSTRLEVEQYLKDNR